MAKRPVYTYWDPDSTPEQAEMLRLWVLSWSARGWRPRILTIRNAARHPRFKSFTQDPREHARLAGEVVRARQVHSYRLINFSGRAGDNPITLRYGHPGWRTADLVTFDSPGDVINCGRPL